MKSRHNSGMQFTIYIGATLMFLTAALGSSQTISRTHRANSRTGGPTATYQNLAGTFHGTLKQLNSKEIVIQTADDQAVVIRRSRKTKFMLDDKIIKAADIPMESSVSIDAAEDIDLKPTALTVTVEKAFKQPATQ